MSQLRSPQFNELESYWYEKLKENGFKDIEDTQDPDRALIFWHSCYFKREKILKQKIAWDAYQERMDAFSNSTEFKEILNLLAKHGNNLFDQEGIMRVWELHRKGTTQREIARVMNCSQTGVHFMLKRIKTWMNLI